MAGGHAGGVRQKIRFHRLEKRLLNSASELSPCAAPIDPLPREVERPRVLVARRGAARLGWPNAVGGKQKPNARHVSPGTRETS